MKIIEALKNLKTIEKRIAKNAESITEYSAYVSTETPHFETLDRQAEEVERLLQANIDLETEYLRLKTAIETTNLAVTVEFGDRRHTISELIGIRRKTAGFRRQTLGALNPQKAMARMKENYNKGIDTTNPPRIVLAFKEQKKIREFTDWDNFVSSIDGRLEVVNAETELQGY